MKNATHLLRTVLALAVVFAMPRFASAAQKTFGSLTPAPASTNVAFGVATNVTSTISVDNGSGASARYAGPATLTASVSPADPSVSATLNATNLTFTSSRSTQTSTLTVATTALTPAGVYVVSIVANTNPAIATVTPITNTFTVTVSSGAAFVPLKVWTPVGGDQNWSTGANWSPTGAPISSNDVLFIDLGATTPGTIDNIVDSTTTIGSLTYGQTNNSHTTQIAAGKTLTITNTLGLASGTGTDNGGIQVMNAIIGATSTLAVNCASANIAVSQDNSTANNAIAQAQSTLDLSGLGNFTATVNDIQIGVDTVIKGASGVLNLARTNTLSPRVGAPAPQIDVGDNSQNAGAPAIASVLALGQSNSIFADSITVGRGKGTGTMLFNSAFASPTAVFRGTGGSSSRVSAWIIGDGFSSRTFLASGTNDFTLGTVDILADQMFVGKGASSASGSLPDTGTGTLSFNAAAPSTSIPSKCRASAARPPATARREHRLRRLAPCQHQPGNRP